MTNANGKVGASRDTEKVKSYRSRVRISIYAPIPVTLTKKNKKKKQRNHLHEHGRMKTATSDEIIIINKRSDVGAGRENKPRVSHRRETPLHTRD